MRTDESLERDGRPDERRVGRLEAVALEVVALLRQADENLSAPVEDDDDDVVDLTV